jgi:hypothetical protein
MEEMSVRRLAIAGMGALLLVGPAATSDGATTTVSGTLQLTLTVTLVSAIPAGALIQCMLSAQVSDSDQPSVLDDISESDTVSPTRSGATALCKMAIPYQWVLHDQAHDTVSLGYTVSTTNPDGVGRFTSVVSFKTIGVPAGGTTSFSASGRI